MKSNAEEKIRLYSVLKSAANERGQKIAEIYLDIFNENMSSRYDETLRSGEYGRGKAQKIFLWLKQRYPELLEKQFQESDQIEDYFDWEDWLERQEFGTLKVHSAAKSSLSIVKFAPQIAQQSLERGEAFFFSFETPASGFIIGFQKIYKDWFLLPLSQSKDNRHMRVSAGQHALPRNLDNNEILPLSEEVHTGKVEFAILIVPDEELDITHIQNLSDTIKIPPEALNALSHKLDALPTVTVFRSAVIVK